MGNYDSIKIPYDKLPVSKELQNKFEFWEELFQTKDLECAYFTYKVENDILMLNGKKVKFTGNILFYGFPGDPNSNNLLEFNIEFKKGKLFNITKI